MKVWIDGTVVDGAQGRIPVIDHGLLYGDGVFEGMRAYGRRAFRLDAHMERIAVSASAIGLQIPGGTSRLRAIVLETLRAFGADDAYIRLIVTRGDGPLGVDPTVCGQPRVICIVDQIKLYDPDRQARGVDLVTVSVRRPASDVLDPRVKSLNYLNSVLAKAEARQRGADEALLLNAAGAIAEAAVANVFVARRGQLRTPPATDGALEGITRDTLLRLAAELGIDAGERTLGRIDLLGADEAFLSGSGVGIVPIRSLDGVRLRSVPGPLTDKLRAAFLDHARTDGVAF